MTTRTSTSSHGKSRHRTPIFNMFRKVVDSVEETVDDVVDRGEGLERDTRRLLHNLFRPKDDDRGRARDEDDEDGDESPKARKHKNDEE